MSSTLYSGQTVNINVLPGESIAISSVQGTFTATIVQGSSMGTVLAIDSTGGGTYGPYTSGAVVRITAGSDSVIDFATGTSPSLTYTNDARFSTDSSGNVTGLVGPGGATLKSISPHLRTKGAIISYMDGARGETVLSETIPATGGTNAASTVGRFTTPTRRVFCATDATNGTVRFNAPAGKSFGRMTSQDSIAVLLYIEACNSTDTLIVTISADNMTNGASATVSLNANKAPGYWWQVIDATAFTGTTTLPAYINSIRTKITRSGATATAVHICGVMKSQQTKPTVIIDFDDAFASAYTNAFQIMNSYGLVGNIAVIQATVGQSAGGLDAFDYCTLKQLQDMRDAGWGMMTHGYYPQNGAPLNTYATIKADMLLNQSYVQNNLASTSNNHYVLPAGQQQTFTDQVLQECGMLSCRGTVGEQTTELPDGVDNIYRLFGTPISASAGLVNMKAKFDTARKCGTTIRYQGHRVLAAVTDTANEILDTDFESFCAYIAPYVASGEVENLTVGDWYSRKYPTYGG